MSATVIDVSSASLRYRLVGEKSTMPLLVFENGWGASFEQWAWIERVLAAQTRLLFYDRAGVGGSRQQSPQTVARLSADLLALLAELNIEAPVVVVGHSYGGLMAALHAAQQPSMVRALIQLDPTPERQNGHIDAQLKLIRRVIAPLSIGLARLGMSNPIFGAGGAALPAPEGEAFMRLSFGRVNSLKNSVRELALLAQIREVIATSHRSCPALVLSAGKPAEVAGLMAHLIKPDKARATIELVQDMHRAQADRSKPGEWQALPHDHGGLVFSETGAKDSAARLAEFVRRLTSSAE